LKYSIDTNALYDAWQRYPYEIFSPLWTNIESIIKDGSLAATCEVLNEIEKLDDELHKWALSQKNMFIPINKDIQLAVRSILSSHQRLVDSTKGRSIADPWIIALAKVNNCTVVTHERFSTKQNVVKIPDVCRAIGVPSITFLDMVKEEGWKF
jgi:predicted nucleic acid-binding protein